MLEWMTGTHLGNLLSTFLISAVPVVELRGGIPWGLAHGLSFWESYVAAVLGNMLPIPFIILFLRSLFNRLRRYQKTRRIADYLETRAHLKGQKVKKYEALGLFLLVAIPLPGTGGWTGALVASALDMRLKRAFPVILLGVMAAGLIMLLLSHGAMQVF